MEGLEGEGEEGREEEEEEGAMVGYADVEGMTGRG